MFRWLINLFKSPFQRSGRVRILIPPELRNPRYNGPSRDNWKYRKQRQYKWGELTPFVNGRKVRFWKQIYSADDQDGDDFVPFFYGKRINKHRYYKKRR